MSFSLYAANKYAIATVFADATTSYVIFNYGVGFSKPFDASSLGTGSDGLRIRTKADKKTSLFVMKENHAFFMTEAEKFPTEGAIVYEDDY